MGKKKFTSEQLFNSLGDALITIDMKGNISAMNPMAESLTGTSVGQFTGQPLETLLSSVKTRSGKKNTELQKLVLAEGRSTWSGELLSHNNNSECRIQVTGSASPIFSTEGKQEGVVLVFHATEELELMGKEKASAEHIIDRMADSVPGAITIIKAKPDGFMELVYASQAFSDIFGLDPVDLSSNAEAIIQRIPESEFLKIKNNLNEHYQTLQPVFVQLQYNHPVKGGVILENWARPVKETDGSILWYGVTRDITEQIKIERSIREHDLLLKQLLESTPDASFAIDCEYKMLINNAHHQQLLVESGSHPFDVGESVLSEDYPESIRAFWRSAYDRAFNGESFALENSWKDIEGKSRVFENRFSPLKNENREIVGALILALEITDRKQAEKVAQEARELAQSLFEVSPAAYSLATVSNRRIIDVNEAWTIMFGYSKSEVVGRPATEFDFFYFPDQRELAFSKLKKDSMLKDYSCDIRTKTGEKRSAFMNTRIEHFGGEDYIISVFNDITDRILVEEKIKESQENYQKLFENNPHPMWVYDLESLAFMEVNDAAIAKYGYSRDEFLKMTILDIRPNEDHELLLSNIAEFHIGMEKSGIWRHVKKDGNHIYVEITSHSLVYSGRKAKLVLANDITDRKKAEEKLRESEQRFATVFAYSPVAIAISWLNNGKIVDVNQSLVDWIGFSREELIGHTTTDLNIWADSDQRQRFVKLLGSNNTVDGMEADMRLKSGELRHILAYGKQISLAGEPCNMIEIIDITDRKLAEQRLREREAELNYAQELAQMASWQVDLPELKLTVSNNYRKLIGIEDRDMEISFEYFLSRLHPDDVHLMTPEKYDLSPDAPPVEIEFRVIMPDGSLKWFQNTMVGEYQNGRMVALKGTNLDITEKINRREEIQRINESLEQRVEERTLELSDLYDNAPCGYHSLDTNGYFERINDTELEWLGYSREEMVGKMSVMEILTPESKETFSNTFPIYKKNGRLEGLELDFIRKDGTILSVLLNATAVYDHEGNYLYSRSTIIDHTDRKNALSALRGAMGKLEEAYKELESFSYSVSHDLRAPLRHISAFSNLLFETHKGRLGEEGDKYLLRINEATHLMGTLIDDLLKLSRVTRSELTLQNINLADIFKSISEEKQRSFPERKIQISFNHDLYAVCDNSLIRLCLNNLFENAWKFTSKTENPEIEFSFKQENDQPVFFIRDNGIGFEMKYADKLFGAFQRLHNSADFEGTGIGLAIVQRVINKHGGRIWVESKPNEGTTFFFTLES